jgi:steroid delta-isomerase-like uncharacterized protein
MKKLPGIIPLVVVLFFTSGCQKQVREEAPTTITENEANIIAKRYVESRNTANLALLDEIYAPGVVVHDCSVPEDIIGLDSLKKYYSHTHKAIPDLHATIDEMIIKGDKIVWIWTFRGTNSGLFHTPMGNIPATGRKVQFSGVAIDRMDKGKIVEEWVYFNVLNVLLQLGFTITPPQPSPPEGKNSNSIWS